MIKVLDRMTFNGKSWTGPNRIRWALTALVLALWLAASALFSPPRASEEDPLEGIADRLKAMTPPEQLTHLRSYLADGLDDARIHFFMGNAFYALEQYDSAITEYESAIEMDEDYSKAIVNMGIAYDTKGDHNNARQAYQRALELNPKDVLAYCHLGFSYQNRGDLAKAIKYYDKALAIDPNSAQAHYNLGLAFATAKIFNEALVEWNKVIELDKDGDLGRVASENVELIKTYMELGN